MLPGYEVYLLLPSFHASGMKKKVSLTNLVEDVCASRAFYCYNDAVKDLRGTASSFPQATTATPFLVNFLLAAISATASTIL